MLEAAQAVQRFVAHRTYDDYLGDELLRSAVERQLEIIGEAARRVSDGLRNSHPEIPWAGIMAQRHVLAHEYGAIDPHRIWQVAAVRVPQLIAQLEVLAPSPPDD